MKRMAQLMAALFLLAGLTLAQQPQQAAPQQQPGQPAPKKQPAPKTKEEYDAYLKFWNATDPDEKIKGAEEFLQKFPESELKPFAFRKEMEAYQQKNDFEKMREFGEKVLEGDPNDAISLILLASAIPERTKETDLDRDQKLNAAEGYAKRALAAIDKLEKPSPQMPDEQWKQVQNDARSNAHASLGLVNLQRKQYSQAEESFRKATELQLQPDPITWWRLGLSLEFGKKYEEALEALKKSVAVGGVKAGGRDLAVEERDRVQKFLDQRKAGGQPPAQQTQPPKPPQ